MKDLLERMQLEKVLCPYLELIDQSLIMHTSIASVIFKMKEKSFFKKKKKAGLLGDSGW